MTELYLVLHNIRSAHNVGSIFRTADAVGVTKIYLCGYTPIPETRGRKLGSDRITKTALGAEKSVSWEYYPQTWRLLKKLKAERINIISLERSKDSVDYRQYRAEFPLAVVLGNEVQGVSNAILKYSDRVIGIPMRGGKESLNVSVAAGVALYKLTENE